MTYKEFENFMVFTQSEQMRRFWNSVKKNGKVVKEEEKDLLNTIRDYDINPVLEEMQKNFQEVLQFPEATKQVEKDYDTYILKLENDVQSYKELEERVFNGKINRIKRQLKLKTLSANVLHSLLQQLQKTVDEEISENPYNTIFTNETGYAIFKRFHSKYKGEKGEQANYSFLFQALEKDKFVFCTGTEFIRFLSEECEVFIDKIDSRQAGKNKKTIAYEAIKELYAEKAQ